MNKRGSGILLHVTSLPSSYGIGDLGPWAFKFADFLAKTKQSYWQILPLNPTDLYCDNSPYYSRSVFAGNPLLISPEILFRKGLLEKAEVKNPPNHPKSKVDYAKVAVYKDKFFHLAYGRFQRTKKSKGYERFCAKNKRWLEDYALFVSIKGHFRGKSWSQWPREIRERKSDVLKSLRGKLHDNVEMVKFLQFIFLEQWLSLKKYCNAKKIQIIGDIPIYAIYDSADVWTHPELFKLDHDKKPYAVAGVPPDYFSRTGQLWGNPVYNWDVLQKKSYDWWIQRVKHNLQLFDWMRIDHFRGFVAYWEVPAARKVATRGRWTSAPAVDFFNTLTRALPQLPIIAEDLGVITPDVIEVKEHFGFPGMKILLFAFGEEFPDSPFLPHNLEKNCVLYTGTHDNNTVRGWIENEITAADKKRLFQYLGRKVPAKDLHWELIKVAMMSVANTAIFPMQDVLGLSGDHRMNRPARRKGNWKWRLLPGQLTPALTEKLKQMTEIYGRSLSRLK
jgi:4-alpha-glucanotransferase